MVEFIEANVVDVSDATIMLVASQAAIGVHAVGAKNVLVVFYTAYAVDVSDTTCMLVVFHAANVIDALFLRNKRRILKMSFR